MDPAGEVVRARPRRELAVAAALLLATALLTLLVALDRSAPPLLDGLDRWWRGLVLPPPAWLEAASRALRTLGTGAVMVPLRIAVALWLLVKHRRADLAAWLLAWAAADLLTFGLKPMVARMRPDLSHASSFPSGHAKTAAQVAVGLVLLVPARARWRPVAWALALAWIVAMAVSRTVLDEHWLSDVVAGSLLGAACAVGALGAVGAVRRARDEPSPGG